MSVRFLEDLSVDGNVGIGTTSPARKLSIQGDGNTALSIISPNTNYVQLALGDTDDDNYGQIILDNSTNKLQIQNGGGGTISDRGITLDSSENVGIGTSSPTYQLHVSSSTNALGVYERVGGASLYLEGQTTKGVIGTVDSHPLVLAADSTEYVRIDTSGNVGIGTESPGSKLDVNGDTNITGYLDITTSSASGSPLIRFNQTTTRRGFIQMADTNNNLRVASEYGSVSLEAASSEGADSDTSYIRIKPGGTVEIGAVDGDATIATDGNMTFRIDADNDETSQKFAFQNNASTEVASLDESGNLSLDGSIELGNASDTTIARSAAGTVTIEGAEVVTHKKFKQIHFQNFVDDLGTTKHYMPFVTNIEQTANYQEEAAMVAVADGRIVSVTVRLGTLTSGSGNLTIGIETGAAGVSYANPWTVQETETIAITNTDDHHVAHFAFDNAKHFDSTDLVAISIQSDVDLHSAAQFWYVSTVIEYDYTTFLGETSAEFDTTP